MKVKPGSDYPLGGGVVNGMRLTGNVHNAQSQTQFFANSRGTIRFIRMNHTAQNAAAQWGRLPIKPPPDFKQWFNQAANWESALCSFKHTPYAEPGEPGPDWGNGPFGQFPFGGVPMPLTTPDIWTALQVWRAATGQPANLQPPPFNTQPGGDYVVLTLAPRTPTTPKSLDGAVLATWGANRVPAPVAYFLAVTARSQLSVPAAQDQRQKDPWGGWVPILFGVPVDISIPLAATRRMLNGACIVAHLAIGELGSVPFFAGQVVLRNVAIGSGWGLEPWGSVAWGI